jgi:hypothetical protein
VRNTYASNPYTAGDSPVNDALSSFRRSSAERRRFLKRGALIPAGTDDVILGSRDDVRGSKQQDNERWRAKFGDATTGFSDDLDDGPPLVENVSNVTYLAQPVILAVAVTEVVAQHWSVVHDDDTVPDNSVHPDYVCLVETG